MATSALPSRNAASSSSAPQSTVPPNQTLYCSNLPDKLQKQDLRLSLYLLFSTYGPVLDVVALKTSKMRGQAHIVFRDIQASTQAMRALQGFNLFGKEMVSPLPTPDKISAFQPREQIYQLCASTIQKISYAKGKSDTVAKLDGTYKMPTVSVPAGAVEATELQQSIFNAPPGAVAISAPPKDTTGMTLKPPNPVAVEEGENVPQGVKRRREEEDEPESDEEDAPMEEDDSDASMEGSSDDE
ncbi:MAG: U2 snRNP complex subunit msl1 [Trichoglossum hirsutum]|nr:MAG: U2 snRNP complex subunit msl1 [Trichoglossum hirsutum]